LRRIVAAEYLSLDGVAEDPGPTGEFKHRGWTVPYWNDELAQLQLDLLFASEALLLGRVTYEEFVASRTLEAPLEWNATLLAGDVAEAVRALKEQPGQDLLIYGSGALVNVLMQDNLIDLCRLMVYPLVLGSGQRFFREGGDKATLELTDAQTTGTGVAVFTYQPAEGPAPNA
jgi:dihydrofolate reductase